MVDIKVNDNKYIFGEDEFEATSGDYYAPEETCALSHDKVDALTRIGKGGKIHNLVEPIMLAADEYVDLPAGSTGYGTVYAMLSGSWAHFYWASDNTVALVDSDGSIATIDDGPNLRIFDNTTSVRIKNSLGAAESILLDYHYTDTIVVPTFRIFSELSGVDNLDPFLTINGITVEPMFRYKGGDADSTDWNYWTYGEDLTAGGSGGSFNDGSPGLGVNDDSTAPEATRYWVASDNTFADITTEDFVLELVFKWSTTNDVRIINKYVSPNGYLLQENVDRLNLLVKDGTDTVNMLSAALTDGCWYHGILFVDRSGSAQWYVNGAASGSAIDVSSVVESITVDSPISLCASSAGANGFDGNLAYVAMWKRYGWLDTHLQATIAAERFAKFNGTYPQIAAGSPVATARARAFPAYLDKVEDGYRKLYYTGSNWLRMCHRQDSAGVNVRGLLAESQVENLFPYSEDFSTWTKVDSGDAITGSAAICPDGRTAATSIAADSTDGSHGVYKAGITLTAATYAFSVFVKTGSDPTYGVNWVRLFDSTTGNYCYFDLDKVDIGTQYLSTGYIEGPFYSGDSTPFYRCCMVFTGTAVGHNLFIIPALANNDATFAGNGSTPNIYIWGAQIELGDYMTSPIRTASAPATRIWDDLEFVAGANIGGEDIGEGTIVYDFLYPSYDQLISRYHVQVSDGGSGLDRIFTGTNSTGDKLRFYSIENSNPAVNVYPEVRDIVDGVRHEYRCTWGTTTTVYADGIDGIPTAGLVMPDDLDLIQVGTIATSTTPANCLIQDLRIYPVQTLKG